MNKTQKGNARAKALVKNFKKMGAKKFFQTWARGIEGITPIQIARANLIGIIPVLIGLIIGIIVVSKSKTTYLILIFSGGLFLSIIQTLGYLQKYIRLKIQDKLMKSLEIQKEIT